MNYNTFINFNQNITELKNENDSTKLIKHILDNTKRTNDKELINKNPELEDIELKEIDLNKIKKDLEQTKELKKGGKGAKPFRFITTTLNVEPTKANEKIIKEWGERMKGLYSKYFNIEGMKIHLNETRPHIHIIAKNFNDKEWGNFVDGKKIKLSGKDGKKLMEQIWKEGEAINRELAKKYNLEFKQQPITEKGEDRKIKQFRAKAQTQKASDDDLNKMYNFLKSKGKIKEGTITKPNDKPDYLLYYITLLTQKMGLKSNGKIITINEMGKLRTNQNLMNNLKQYIEQRFITPEQKAKLQDYEKIKNQKPELTQEELNDLWLADQIKTMYGEKNQSKALEELNKELNELDQLRAEKQEKAKKSPTLSRGYSR